MFRSVSVPPPPALRVPTRDRTSPSHLSFFLLETLVSKSHRDREFGLVLCKVPSSSASPHPLLVARGGAGVQGMEAAAAVSAADPAGKKSSMDKGGIRQVSRSGSED